jgi:hypothetical protein
MAFSIPLNPPFQRGTIFGASGKGRMISNNKFQIANPKQYSKDQIPNRFGILIL